MDPHEAPPPSGLQLRKGALRDAHQATTCVFLGVRPYIMIGQRQIQVPTPSIELVGQAPMVAHEQFVQFPPELDLCCSNPNMVPVTCAEIPQFHPAITNMGFRLKAGLEICRLCTLFQPPPANPNPNGTGKVQEIKSRTQ